MNWALAKNSMLNIATRPLESYQVVMSERDLNRTLMYYAIIPGALRYSGYSSISSAATKHMRFKFTIFLLALNAISFGLFIP